MNVLFLNCAYSELQIDLFQRKSKRGYQYAAQNFQEAVINGLLSSDDVELEVLSIPSLSSYPLGNKLRVVKSCPFVYRDCVIGKSFGYLNIPIIKNKHQKKIDVFIDNWYDNNPGEKTILVYALLRQQMQYAVTAKIRHPDIKLSIVIPDLPMYMSCNKYYKILGLQKRDMAAIEALLHSFDCYVVLAEPMVYQLHIEGKPYVVVEGIYDGANLDNSEKSNVKNKTILYAGGIQTRYGVFDLIDAFHRIKYNNYNLILCGPCPEMEKLNKYISTDSRISYLGLISTTQVRELQKNVTLLVNPRHSTEVFTKYSFPSKTIEYMASGTPVLMNCLPSMPDEYKEYLYLFDDESVEGMRKMIEKVCGLDSSELRDKGNKAKDFIIKNKNAVVQVEKVLNLIKSL